MVLGGKLRFNEPVDAGKMISTTFAKGSERVKKSRGGMKLRNVPLVFGILGYDEEASQRANSIVACRWLYVPLCNTD